MGEMCVKREKNTKELKARDDAFNRESIHNKLMQSQEINERQLKAALNSVPPFERI